MAGCMWPKKVTFLLIFSSVILFLDVNANECTGGCKEGVNSNEGFVKGHTYTYALDGSANVFLTANDDQQTGAKISAEATVYALGNCSNLLKVTFVQFTGPDGKKYTGSDDFAKPIQFTMQDGVVSPQFCAEDGDSERSLNVKRAIISMLQTATNQKTEVDIFGVCPTIFENSGQKIKKKKNLNTCKNRGQSGHDALYQLHSIGSMFKSSKVMKGNLKSEVTLNSGIIERAVSQEEYYYTPFSVKQSGARANVDTKLVLKESKEGSLNANCVVSRSIIFETSKVVHDENSLENIKSALKTTTQYLDGHVQQKSASFFAALIRVMRGAKTNDLYKIYSQIENDSSNENKELTNKVFLDALFRVGTGDSIEMTIKLIKDKELNMIQEKVALASLTSVRYASADTLLAMTDLLNVPKLPNEVYLGAGAIAAAYYRNNADKGYDKTKNEAVIALSAKLVSKLGSCKATSKENENMIISVLKALRNMKKIEDNAVETLITCVTDETVKQRVKVAALETFISGSRKLKLRAPAYTILNNITEDSELRIKAYLVLLEYPTRKLAKTLEKLLTSTDTNNQVGSFISSSLKNIQKSTGETYRAARIAFKPFEFTTEYPVDPRKYSQTFYGVYGVNIVDAHAIVQSNVIYSQRSFMPRSVNLNLTVEVFGKNINLIEVGARQGNLDRVLEEYFGPKGSLKTPQQIYDSWKETTDSVYNNINKRFNKHGQKTKRDVQEEIAVLGKKLKTEIAEYKGDFDFDVYVKLFGSDAIFLSLGDDQDFSVEAIVDRLFDAFEGGIDASKEFLHEVRSHILFLDMELAYPTSSGMPLKLNTEGASTAKLTFGGDFDLRQLFGDIFNAKVDFQIMPSASIEVIGTLSVDADAFSTGLKTTSILQTSTGVHFTGKFLDGEGFQVKVGLPIERQEIITASNDAVFYTREKGRMDVDKSLIFDTVSDSPKPDCYENLAKTTGLTVCIETVQPIKSKGKTVSNGPTKYAVYLDKSDIKSYNFKGVSSELADGVLYEMIIEAEGAKLPKQLLARFEDKYHGRGVYITLDSPIKRIEVSAAYVISFTECIMKGHLLYGEDRIAGKLGFNIKENGKRTTLTPVWEFVKPGYKSDTIKVIGLVQIDKVNGIRTMVFDGLGISIGDEKVTLDGSNTVDSGALTWNLKGAGYNHTASIDGMFLVNHKDAAGVTVNFQNSYRPDWNILYKSIFHYTVDDESFKTSSYFTFVHGPDFETTTNIITYNFSASGDLDKYNMLKAEEIFTYPLYELQYTDELEYINGEKFLVSFDGKYKKRTLELSCDLESNAKDNLSSAKFKAIMDGVGGEVYMKVDETEDDLTKITSHLLFSPNKKYEMIATMKGFDSQEGDDMDVHFTTAITLPSKAVTTFDMMFFSKDNLIKTRILLSTGAINYFEFSAKLDNVNNLADLKIFLKDIILAKADYALKPNDKKIVSVINVELYQIEKVYQVETEVIMNAPKFTGEVKAYTDFSKNKKELYRLTTANIIEDGKLDSKNVIFYGNEKTKLNAKFTKENGGGLYSVEANLVDFHETDFKLVYSQKNEEEDDTSNVDIQFLLEEVDNNSKNSTSLTWQVKMDNFNSENGLGSAFVSLDLINPDGEVLVYNVSKMTKEDDSGTEGEYKFDLAGLYLPRNVSLYGWYEMKDNGTMYDVDYKLNGECGKDASLAFVGNISFDLSRLLAKNYFNFIGNLPKNAYGQKVLFETEEVIAIKKTIINKLGYTYTEMLVNARCDIDEKSSRFHVSHEYGGHTNTGKLHIQLPEFAPFMLEIANQKDLNIEDNKLHTSSSVVITMNNEEVSFNATGYTLYPLGNQGEYNTALHLPEKWGYHDIKTDVVYSYAMHKNFDIDMTVNMDNKIYNYVTAFHFNRDEILLVDIKTTYPDSLVKRFYIKADNLSSNNFHAQVKMKNYGDFNLDLDVNGELRSTEDFKLTVDVDCAKASFNKVHFKAASEPVDGHQHVKIVATEDKKSFLDGLVSYKTNVEDGTLHVNGDGKLTFRGKEKSSKFQYTYLNNEGIYVTFDGSIEGYGFKVDHQNEKNLYKFFYSYQVDGISHANVSLESKIVPALKGSHLKSAEFFNVNVDLRKIGFPTEFGLSTTAEYNHLVPVYSIIAHATRDDRYYEIEKFAKADKGRLQTLLKITLPSREINMETSNTYSYSLAKQYKNPLFGEVIFYLNKKDPKSKTHFRTSIDFFNHEQDQYALNGEIFFIHPGMTKEWKIEMESKCEPKSYQGSVKALINIFKRQDQMLTEVNISLAPKNTDYYFGYEAKVKSNGKVTGVDISYFGNAEFLVSDYNSLELEANSLTAVGSQMQDYKFHYSCNPNIHQFIVKHPAGDLVNYKRIFKTDDGSAPLNFNWESELILYNNLTYKFKGYYDDRDGTHASWSGGLGSDDILLLSALSIPNKEVGFSAKYNHGKEDYPLFNIGYEISNTKSPISTCKANELGLRKFFGRIAENCRSIKNGRDQFYDGTDIKTKSINTILTAFISEAIPSLRTNYFKGEMDAILNEVKADSFLKGWAKPLEMCIDIWAKLNEGLSNILYKIYDTNDVIYQFWKTNYFISCVSSGDVFNAFLIYITDLIDPMVNVTLGFVNVVDMFIENYASAWNTVYNFVYDISTVFNKSVNFIKESMPWVYKTVKELVMNSFPVRVMDGRYKFFSNENLENLLKTFEETFINVLPEKEWSLFKKNMLYFNDLESHRKDKDFKNMGFKDLTKSAGQVVLGATRRVMGEYGLNVNWHSDVFMQVVKKTYLSFLSDINIKIKLPKRKYSDDIDLFLSLWARPNNIIFPNKLKGFTAGGKNIITFDGSHYLFPGDCKYVLAQDAIDGNFSIIMHLDNGEPKSVTVVDKSGSSVEVDNERKVVEEGFGVSKIKVFKRTDYFVIKSSYGASVKCSYSLDICYYKVSGYYFGKLRGLLGDGNSESVDDFKIPDGEFASSEYDLGNQYALSSDCPNINAPDNNESETTTETEATTGNDTETGIEAQKGNETETETKVETEVDTEVDTNTENDTETETTTENNENSEQEERPDFCSDIFNEDSNLSDCYLSTDLDLYTGACNEAVAAASVENEKSAACLIARAYVLASKANKCHATLPDICVQCDVDGFIYDFDDESLTIKTPSQKADIVLVVKMAASNKEIFEEIVIPVVNRIQEELKLNNIDDLNVHLVGIRRDSSHPMFFDFENGNLNGSKITFDNEEGPSIFATSPEYVMPIHTSHSKVDEYLQESLNSFRKSMKPFVLDEIDVAFWRLNQLQLRPNATKTFIMVDPKLCPRGAAAALFNFYERYVMKDEGTVVHYISPMSEISLDENEDLVGFNIDEIYSIGDRVRTMDYIYYRKNPCAGIELALRTYGNVYSTHAFSKMTPEQKEKYINLTAKTITDSMTKFAYEKECSCELGFMELFPRVTCKTTSRKRITV